MIISRYLSMLCKLPVPKAAPVGCLSRGGDTPVDVAALLKGGDVLKHRDRQTDDLRILDSPIFSNYLPSNMIKHDQT